MSAVLRTAIALFALWALSFGLSFVDFGWASLPLALAIAAVKAVLVALVFMELAGARPSIVLAVVAAGLLVSTLIGLMVVDVVTRDRALDRPPDQPRAGDGSLSH